MQAEVTLIAVIVLLFLYDLIAGSGTPPPVFGRRLRTARAAGRGQCRSGDSGRVFGGMFQYVPMHSVVKSVLTVGTLIVFLQADAWLRRGDTAHKQASSTS